MRLLRPFLAALTLLLFAAPGALAHDGEFHGDPRTALPDSLVVQPVEQEEMADPDKGTAFAAEQQLPETWCGTERTTDDLGNAVSAPSIPQFKLIYAYASDQPNRFAQFDDRLQANVSILGRFLAQQSGDRKALRWDMGTSCGPEYVDIQVIQLPKTRAEYVPGGAPDFVKVVNDVAAVVGSQSGPRNWAIYADNFFGTNGVAGTAWRRLSDTPNTNAHNQGRLESVVFGPSSPPSTYAWPAVMLHEISHNLGAVQDSAPHTTGNGHCNDRYDVMCYPDGGPTSSPTYPCPKIGGVVDETYDCGGDDYFNPTPAAGSYLTTHWNIFSSAHLGSCESELTVACGLDTGGDPPDPDDETAPTNTTPAAPTGWRASDYVVELAGSDTQSAVNGWNWRVDDEPDEWVRTATVEGDGVHTLSTRVRDAAGNWSPWRDETVRIDATAPEAELVCSSGPGTAMTCTGTAADDLSGPDRLELQAGNGPVTVTDGSDAEIVVDAEGETVVRTRTRDAAGNWSGWASMMVRITKPVVDDPTGPGATVVTGDGPVVSSGGPAGGGTDVSVFPRSAVALLKTPKGKSMASALLAVANGKAVLSIAPGKLSRGTWRLKACIGYRCAGKTFKLRRARKPSALRAELSGVAAPSVRASFTLQRFTRKKFRTVALAFATA